MFDLQALLYDESYMEDLYLEEGDRIEYDVQGLAASLNLNDQEMVDAFGYNLTLELRLAYAEGMASTCRGASLLQLLGFVTLGLLINLKDVNLFFET